MCYFPGINKDFIQSSIHPCKMCVNTCRRTVISFNIFTDVLAVI